MNDLATQLNERIKAAVAQAIAMTRSGAANAGAYDARIPGWLAEAARQSFASKTGQGKRVNGRVVSLRATLGSAAATGTDDYGVPQGFDFEVYGISGLLGPSSGVSLNSEVAVAAALGTNLIPSERRLLAAMNCRVGLVVDGASVPIFENENPYLSDLLDRPLIFGNDFPRLVIPSQKQIRLSVALQDTTAAIVGVNKEYGVMLHGAMITCDD